MGILAFFVGGTTKLKALTDSMNRDLPATNQINFLSIVMLASMDWFHFDGS